MEVKEARIRNDIKCVQDVIEERLNIDSYAPLEDWELESMSNVVDDLRRIYDVINDEIKELYKISLQSDVKLIVKLTNLNKIRFLMVNVKGLPESAYLHLRERVVQKAKEDGYFKED